MSWVNYYIGKPWKRDAEGPAAFDCKGLVRDVEQKHAGKSVPRLLNVGRLTDWAAVRESVARDGWRPVKDRPREFDILTVRGKDGPHVGVFVRIGRRLRVLHAHGYERDGRSIGRVRHDDLADLLAGGYGHPRIWRCE
ncbi:hypothetical protein [Caldimonas sp. KR1-144]|uniref:hypothetical protein n=1 Tax=Caldimonas sp. KR1-144 TaxID=3400911 RepID=UPI003C0B7E48